MPTTFFTRGSRLRFAAPAQVVVHRADNGEHGARGVHCIAAALEYSRAGSRAERLAGDGDPVAPMEDRLVSLGKWFGTSRQAGAGDDEEKRKAVAGTSFHSWTGRIVRPFAKAKTHISSADREAVAEFRG